MCLWVSGSIFDLVSEYSPHTWHPFTMCGHFGWHGYQILLGDSHVSLCAHSERGFTETYSGSGRAYR